MKRNHIIILIVSLVVLAGAGAGLWYWRKKKKEKEQEEGGDGIKDTLEVELNPEQQKQRATTEKVAAEKKKLSSAEQKARTVFDQQSQNILKKVFSKITKPSPKLTLDLLKTATKRAATKVSGAAPVVEEPVYTPEIQKKRM